MDSSTIKTSTVKAAKKVLTELMEMDISLVVVERSKVYEHRKMR